MDKPKSERFEMRLKAWQKRIIMENGGTQWVLRRCGLVRQPKKSGLKATKQ